ncbi:MAG: DUF6798 domain-containing protein [Planctomyces sp.]
MNVANDNAAFPAAAGGRGLAAVWLFFTAVSFLVAPLPAVNEPHYLCKARSLADPAWCTDDFFLQSANAHYCFLLLTGSATRVAPLWLVTTLGRIASCGLLACGWIRISAALGLNQCRSYAAALLFAACSLVGSFSGEWVLGGFESKVPAWGLAMLAVAGWLTASFQHNTPHRTLLIAGLCSGLGSSLHPVVGGWLAVCLCAAQLFASPGGLRHRLRGLLLFAVPALLAALPGLIPAVLFLRGSAAPGIDLSKAGFIQVFWRLRHHLDPTELTAQQWLYALIMLVIIAVGWFRLSPRQRPAARLLLALLAGSLLIAVAGLVIGWHNVPVEQLTDWRWRASLLRFYPFRTFDALLPMCASLLTVLAIGSRWPDCSPAETRGLTILTLVTLLAALAVRPAAPPGYSAAQYAEWRQACEWLRQHTAPDALILTPRESFGFKWYAERAEYVCYKDCPQDAAGILEWDRRLWLLHEWTLSSSQDGRYDARDLELLRQRTDCDYILTRILGPFADQPVWRGREWGIYRVPRGGLGAEP